MIFDKRYNFYNMQLFDGERGRLVSGKSVLVEGDKIVAVQDGDGAVDIAGIEPVDLHGLTLLPGLIDAHVHITVPFMHKVTTRAFFNITAQIERNARTCIEAGITTVRDAGGFPRRLNSLISAVNSGDLPGPRIIKCNSCITTPGGCPDWVPYFNPLIRYIVGGQYAERVNTPAEARARVEEMLRMGADWIKIYCQHRSWLLGGGDLPVFDRQTFAAIMDTAHKNHRKVCAHISWLKDLEYAMSMGVDTFEHCPIEEIPEVVAGEFAARDMALNPTLTCLDLGNDQLWEMLEEMINEGGETILEPEPLRQVREHIATYRKKSYPPPARQYLKRPYFDIPLFAQRFEQILANIGRMLRAGARVGVATDSGGLPTALFGVFYIEELKRLMQAGLSCAQVLMAATSGNAAILGIDNTLGSIRPGKTADMIAVQGNPLENLDAMRNVQMVMKGGRFLKREQAKASISKMTKWGRR
jgi:imidazolonepropionase-like amidohydrolase